MDDHNNDDFLQFFILAGIIVVCFSSLYEHVKISFTELSLQCTALTFNKNQNKTSK